MTDRKEKEELLNGSSSFSCIMPSCLTETLFVFD